jgi:hypothetical protein
LIEIALEWTVEVYDLDVPNSLGSFLGVTLLLAVFQGERGILAHMTHELTVQTAIHVNYSNAIRYTKYISLEGLGSLGCDPEP